MSSYRKDIQGLRALAVLGVMIYHFSQKYLPSGFAGVDVFFVISGYLMTKIIIAGITSNSFKLIKFYIARAKRIIPSLMSVISVLLIIGYLFIEPLTYKELGKQSISSLLFFSNYQFFSETGYFDQSAKEKFLLHTWSLSVEWLFYLIYPIFIVVFVKFFGKDNIIKCLFIALSLSFIYCIETSKDGDSFSYFMIYTRAWEMIAGGIIYSLPENDKIKDNYFISLLGVVGIVLSFLIFNEQTSWPSFHAILPVVSTALVIYAGGNLVFLNNKVMQYIGAISYSLYLVHWCIIVLTKKMYINIDFIEYIILTFSLAIALNLLVERRRDFGYMSISYFCIIVIASLYVSIDGAASRMPKVSEYRVSSQEYRNNNEGHNGIRDSDEVVYLNSSESNFDIILIGSSHAKHYYSYIMKHKLKVASFALDGCNVTKDYYANRSNIERCIGRYKMQVNFINNHPGKKVVWATNRQDLKEPSHPNDYSPDSLSPEKRWGSEINYFLDDIKGSESKVFLVGDAQGSDKLMFECMGKNELFLSKYFGSLACNTKQPIKYFPLDDQLKLVAESHQNVTYISASDALCNDKECYVIENNKPIYTDYGHLSKSGAEIVGSYIFGKIGFH